MEVTCNAVMLVWCQCDVNGGLPCLLLLWDACHAWKIGEMPSLWITWVSCRAWDAIKESNPFKWAAKWKPRHYTVPPMHSFSSFIYIDLSNTTCRWGTAQIKLSFVCKQHWLYLSLCTESVPGEFECPHCSRGRAALLAITGEFARRKQRCHSMN